MALNFTVSYTFTPSTTISSSQVNTNTSDVANVFIGLEAMTKTLAALKMDNDPSTALEVATKQYVDHYGSYRRPNLKWVSVTQVDVEANTGTSNTTKIQFPDGNLRTVTEDTSATHKYRRFDITAGAEFTSGTEDSGLRSGLSEASNTFYCIYAVKSLINSANFVLAGDTTTPTTANFATLNSRYGTDSWVYLGGIKNGDSAAAASSILDFVQNGPLMVFKNTSAGTVRNMTGMLCVTTASANNVTYTYASGTGSQQIPDHILIVKYQGVAASIAGSCIDLTDSGGTRFYASVDCANTRGTVGAWMAAVEGARVDHVQAGNVAIDIFMTAYMDSVLGVGANPII